MALSSLRLRRALALPASFLKHRPFSAAAVALPPSPPLTPSTPPSKPGFPAPTRLGGAGLRPHYAIQRLSFRSSAPLSDRRWGDGEDSKIDPDEILFEGCDYNHWLITMDFPKDPKPTPEEMVETYVQTLAKVVGSVEEAKKRMYACSTTTYTGFQAVMTEEMSEKFRGLPGVVFILPDSYIDPINKEYGGDKYDNGVITPRPPPVQYGRQGRYGDRNRNFDRPRYDRQPMQQRNQSVYQQGPPQGEGRNDAPQQNYDRYDRQPMQQRNPSFYQQGPPQGEGRNDAPQQNYGQDRYDRQPMQQKNPSFYHQGPPQGEGRSDAPQQNYGQDRNFSQGQQGSGYRHGTSSGYGGAYQQHGSAYGQNFTGASGQNYGQSNSGLREGQPPPHVDDQGRMTQREQSNFTYPPPTGENQGRY